MCIIAFLWNFKEQKKQQTFFDKFGTWSNYLSAHNKKKESKKWKQRLEKSLNSKLQKSFPGYLYHFLQWFALFFSPQFLFSVQYFLFVCYCTLYQFSIIILPHTHTVGKRKSMKWLYFSTSLIKTFSIFIQVQSKMKKDKLNTNHFILFSLYFSHKTSPLHIHKLFELSLE